MLEKELEMQRQVVRELQALLEESIATPEEDTSIEEEEEQELFNGYSITKAIDANKEDSPRHEPGHTHLHDIVSAWDPFDTKEGKGIKKPDPPSAHELNALDNHPSCLLTLDQKTLQDERKRA